MCITCATDSGQDYFCEPCWKGLTLKMKQRWWEIVKHGARQPSDDEIAEFVKQKETAT